jgi:predicted metal-dependent hydrolase
MKIIKSIRKTITMKIDENGEVIIKAPLFLGIDRIDEFVNKHKVWISEKQKIVRDRKKNYEN